MLSARFGWVFLGKSRHQDQRLGRCRGLQVWPSSGQHFKTLRVQVPNTHIPTQKLYYNYYSPNPKYLVIGYMDPLGDVLSVLKQLRPKLWHLAGGIGFWLALETTASG